MRDSYERKWTTTRKIANIVVLLALGAVAFDFLVATSVDILTKDSIRADLAEFNPEPGHCYTVDYGWLMRRSVCFKQPIAGVGLVVIHPVKAVITGQSILDKDILANYNYRTKVYQPKFLVL